MRWTTGDEGRHDDERGVEQWGFGFAGEDAAGEIRLAFDVAHARAGFVADLRIGAFGRVVVAEEEVPLPRPTAGLEIRAEGLWASLLCETAFEHWSLGLEAFGLRVDDEGGEPVGWGELLGERLPVGFDLEWELTGAATPLDRGYRQPGTVFGELLVVRDRVAVDAPAWREHWWGGGRAAGTPGRA